MKRRGVLQLCGVLVAAFPLLGPAVTGAGELRGSVVGSKDSRPVAVWVEGLPGNGASGGEIVLTHNAGRFEPYLSLGFVGGTYVLRNEDDTLHNTHLYLRLGYQKKVSGRPLHYGATLFNVALPRAGQELRRPIEAHHRYRDETGFIEVRCNPHPEEEAYVLVFDHPYAGVTGKDGRFSIPDLPPGSHEVRYWAAGVVKTWKTVEVRDGLPTEVRIELE